MHRCSSNKQEVKKKKKRKQHGGIPQNRKRKGLWKEIMPFGRMVQLQELAGAHQRVVLSFRCEGSKLGGKQFPSGGCMSSPRKRSSQCCLFFFFFFLLCPGEAIRCWKNKQSCSVVVSFDFPVAHLCGALQVHSF